eukprot:TRINITY_DN5367_c0_g1_i2.p1 TRINITY_DN5367_c0_g1~~TRINITY_DN5367_c0_g1_i2.p1  ORF type:complete len:142 (-),score=15.17 TRINITY_DN5367_c0_g1_i2:124-549(-)
MCIRDRKAILLSAIVALLLFSGYFSLSSKSNIKLDSEIKQRSASSPNSGTFLITAYTGLTSTQAQSISNAIVSLCSNGFSAQSCTQQVDSWLNSNIPNQWNVAMTETYYDYSASYYYRTYYLTGTFYINGYQYYTQLSHNN